MENKKLNTYSLIKAQDAYHKLLEEQGKDKDFQLLVNEISHGENFLRQTYRVEVKTFDSDFINELEEGIGAINKIVSNPRTFIKEERELVEAALAKKVSPASIRHFASHTQFIQDVDEDDNVRPSKILTINTETDTAIYENRFIMTLIKKCLAFMQARYSWIIEHGETYNSDLLLVHNKTVIEGVTYEIDTRIKASIPSLDDGNSKKNKELLDRLTSLRDKCSYFLHSPFMSAMKGAKDVSSPIHMTNMLLKHPDYHRAYQLWCFIDEYEDAGLSFDITETNQVFSKKYKEELANFTANSLLTLHSNQVKVDEIEKKNKIKYEPKIIFSLEDITYADGRFLYDAYPEAKNKKDIPLPPLPEEVRLENEKFLEKLKKQKDAKILIDRAILSDKDKIIYDEAMKRVHKEMALEAEHRKLIYEASKAKKEAEILRKENEELKKKLKELKSPK